MNLRARRALIVGPALIALSAGTLVAANADDATTATDTARKSRGYKFLSQSAGYNYIARWSPCGKIHYKINARKAPGKGAVKDVRKAIKRVHGASGLRFEYDGKTRMVPRDASSKPYKGKTDLVVAWTTAKKRKKLKGRTAGWGGGYWRHYRGARYGKFYKGYVLLDKKPKYPRGFGEGGRFGTRGQLLMHELGHSVGLDHVRDRKQIMFPYTRHMKAQWGNGDLKGLKKVGRPAGCGGFRKTTARTTAPVIDGAGHGVMTGWDGRQD